MSSEMICRLLQCWGRHLGEPVTSHVSSRWCAAELMPLMVSRRLMTRVCCCRTARYPVRSGSEILPTDDVLVEHAG
jgi:hypothetical protein